MQIIVKNYSHYNSAFGTYVRDKDHYDRLMKENNYISYEECLDRTKNNGKKPYILSEKARAIIQAAKDSKDKKGRVKLSDRTIDAMKEIGAIKKSIPSHMRLPSSYSDKGGFE